MDWLKYARKSRQLTQLQVARQVAITQESYCNIENGQRCPSVLTAKKIADTLGFDWTLFFKDTETSASEEKESM